MKIGISTSVIQRGRSGVARYVIALTEALLSRAATHQFFLFVLEEDRPLFAFAEPRMTIVPVPERYRPPVRDIMWHQTVLPVLAHRHALDVLHIPSYRRMVQRAPCALVATIHDLAPFHLAGKYDWPRMVYGRMVARRLAHRQDRIISVSRATAQDLCYCYGLPGGRVTVVPNGIDTRLFYPGDGETARAWGAARHGADRPFFLYVARLEHPGKNHVRLIEAFNRFKARTGSNWQLVLGGSDWHGAEEIHDCIRRSPFAGEIRTLGFVPEEDLPNWYRAAGAFVYPSLFEGFGLPPLEAMACGTPVLCSKRGALGEVTGRAAATMDPEDVSDMEQQLARIAEDAAWRSVLRAAGIRRAQRYTWEQAAAATMEVYAQARGIGCLAA